MMPSLRCRVSKMNLGSGLDSNGYNADVITLDNFRFTGALRSRLNPALAPPGAPHHPGAAKVNVLTTSVAGFESQSWGIVGAAAAPSATIRSEGDYSLQLIVPSYGAAQIAAKVSSGLDFRTLKLPGASIGMDIYAPGIAKIIGWTGVISIFMSGPGVATGPIATKSFSNWFPGEFTRVEFPLSSFSAALQTQLLSGSLNNQEKFTIVISNSASQEVTIYLDNFGISQIPAALSRNVSAFVPSTSYTLRNQSKVILDCAGWTYFKVSKAIFNWKMNYASDRRIFVNGYEVQNGEPLMPHGDGAYYFGISPKLRFGEGATPDLEMSADCRAPLPIVDMANISLSIAQ